MQFNQEIRTIDTVERVQYSDTTKLSAFLGGMDNSDVPFVYHHLKKGCILKLNAISGIHTKHLMYGVNYGSYRLGILSSTMASRIRQIELNNTPYRITISKIEKEKYLPPTAIKVELEWGN